MKNLLSAKKISIEIGDQIICRHLDFEIEPGKIYAVLGPNGSGKTTLLHSLAGLYQPSEGEIYFQNKELSLWNKKHLAQHLGILFQDDIPHFSQTTFECCLAGRNPHLNRFTWENAHDIALTQTALETVQLDKKAHQKIHTLSGGEKRRLAIATLLTQSPQLYLLDEPLNHLDLRHQMLVLNHFKKLIRSASISVLMSLHDLNIAQHFCDYILLLMGDGTYLGKPDEVLTTESISRLYQVPVEKNFLGQKTFWSPWY